MRAGGDVGIDNGCKVNERTQVPIVIGECPCVRSASLNTDLEWIGGAAVHDACGTYRDRRVAPGSPSKEFDCIQRTAHPYEPTIHGEAEIGIVADQIYIDIISATGRKAKVREPFPPCVAGKGTRCGKLVRCGCRTVAAQAVVAGIRHHGELRGGAAPDRCRAEVAIGKIIRELRCAKEGEQQGDACCK